MSTTKIVNIEHVDFKTMFPTFIEWNEKIIDKLKSRFNNPDWLDDTKSFYKQETIYIFMYEAYYDSFTVDDEIKCINSLLRALSDLLPEVYMKSLSLQTSNLAKLDFDALMSTVEKSFYEEPEINHVTTYSAISSTPTETPGIKMNENIDKARQRDATQTIDKRRANKQVIDYIKSLSDLTKLSFVGLINQIISHPYIVSLFNKDLDYIVNNYKIMAVVSEAEVIKLIDGTIDDTLINDDTIIIEMEDTYV